MNASSSSSNATTLVNITTILTKEYCDSTFDCNDSVKNDQLRSIEAEFNNKFLLPGSILPLGQYNEGDDDEPAEDWKDTALYAFDAPVTDVSPATTNNVEMVMEEEDQVEAEAEFDAMLEIISEQVQHEQEQDQEEEEGKRTEEEESRRGRRKKGGGRKE